VALAVNIKQLEMYLNFKLKARRACAGVRLKLLVKQEFSYPTRSVSSRHVRLHRDWQTTMSSAVRQQAQPPVAILNAAVGDLRHHNIDVGTCPSKSRPAPVSWMHCDAVITVRWHRSHSESIWIQHVYSCIPVAAIMAGLVSIDMLPFLLYMWY
jgi:hypothetical protein